MLFCVTHTLFSQELGDVNSDTVINIVDALLIAQFYVNLNPANFNEAKAEVDCNGVVNIIDALLVAKYYVRLITAFPCDAVTPEPTMDPHLTPTPDQGPNLDGRWSLDSYVNLVLNSEQTIYDHSVEEWSGVVEMSGYVNDTIITDVNIGGGSGTYFIGKTTIFTLTTDINVYPNYTIKLIFNDHISLRLVEVNALVREDETTSKEFKAQESMYPVQFTWEPNVLLVNLIDIPSVEGTDTLSFDITLNRKKTLTLDPDIPHKSSYPSVDLISYITISGSSFETTFTVEGDIGVRIAGSVEIDDNRVILNYSMNPAASGYVAPPIIMEMITMDDVLYLKRIVTEPTEQAICDYYGINPSALESFDYYQLYVLRE
jgi:hypothetical protein